MGSSPSAPAIQSSNPSVTENVAVEAQRSACFGDEHMFDTRGEYPKQSISHPFSLVVILPRVGVRISLFNREFTGKFLNGVLENFEALKYG